MKKRMASILLILAFSLSSLTGCIKVVKIGEEGKLTGQVDFNADSDVASIWESQAVPELAKKAVDLKTFLTEANGNLKSLDQKYGKYSMGTSGELSYVVKGTANIATIDQEKKAGTMQISLDGYTGSETIKLQIGSVYKGSAIRDSLDFIKYEDYKNQVEWAAISQSIHSVVQEKVITPLDVGTLASKTIDFIGCFTVAGNDELLITPVQITVK